MSHKPSGSQRRKLQKERDESHSQIVKKLRKLDQFFSPCVEESSNDTAVPSTSTGNVLFQKNQDASEILEANKNVDAGKSDLICKNPEDDIDNNSKLIAADTKNQDRNNEKINVEPQHCFFGAKDRELVIPLCDPAKWPVLDSTVIDYIIRNQPKQEIDHLDFSTSKRHYGTGPARYATKKMFLSRLPNGQIQKREWLMYSESKGSLFCIACKLFHSGKHSFTEGFTDWKNSDRLGEHERSYEHRKCTKEFVSRGNVLGKLDTALHKQYLAECDYWGKVLHRVMNVIKFLGTRGLAFRGNDERFSSHHNGNYMGLLELIAHYDPFLENHIETRGNPGSGNISYLSKSICEEFITLLYESTINKIILELKLNKYYSITVDSTPDVTHADQLTFVVRYVREDGMPVERFIKFIRLPGHAAVTMEKIVLDTLSSLEIDINDCRGQSYDNASNMAGQYAGLQALIKRNNPLAVFVPCSAHSLNLVGVAASNCCVQATKFFMFVQQIYTFLSASTSRWAIVLENIKNDKGDKMFLPKSLSQTRWSARWDACKALSTSYEAFHRALIEISENPTGKPETKVEAAALSDSFEKLENAIMLVFWTDVLERFDKASKVLQSTTVTLNEVVHLYNSLEKYISGLKDRFDSYESRGKAISNCDSYQYDTRRPRKQKLQFDEPHNAAMFDGKADMRINAIFVIIDKLKTELTRRASAYSDLHNLFGFLQNFLHLSSEELRKNAERLYNAYTHDLAPEFMEECVHFKEFIVELKSDGDEIQSPLDFLKIIREKNIVATFPNIDTALKIFLTILPSNASGERSFSVLKRIKNFLRNSITDSRLSSLACFTANAEILEELNFEILIDQFATLKARKCAL